MKSTSKFLLLCGKKETGKSTCAEYIKSKIQGSFIYGQSVQGTPLLSGAVELTLANPLKIAVQNIFNLSEYPPFINSEKSSSDASEPTDPSSDLFSSPRPSSSET